MHGFRTGDSSADCCVFARGLPVPYDRRTAIPARGLPVPYDPPSDTGDRVDNNGNGAADEGVGHGTFIASLIGLTAPGARHLHIKVLNDEGECQMSDLLAALEACIAEDVHVVNLSIVPLGSTTILKGAFAALRLNGTIVVASAGNAAATGNPFGTSEEDLVQVGATTEIDTVWSGSSTGTWVDIMAPGFTRLDAEGAAIPQRAVVGVVGVEANGAPTYAAASGTSFAAAFVSGAAACFRAANPSWPDDTQSSEGAVAPGDIAGIFRNALVASGVTLSSSTLKRLDAGALVAGFDPVPRCPGDIVRATSGEGPRVPRGRPRPRGDARSLRHSADRSAQDRTRQPRPPARAARPR